MCVCESVLCLHVGICTMFEVYVHVCSDLWSQKRVLGIWDLELQTVVSLRVGAGHQPMSSARTAGALQHQPIGNVLAKNK